MCLRIVEQGMPFSRSQIALFDGKTTISVFPLRCIIRKEAEKPLQNGQIAFGNPKTACALDSSQKELPLVDGLAGTDAWDARPRADGRERSAA